MLSNQHRGQAKLNRTAVRRNKFTENDLRAPYVGCHDSRFQDATDGELLSKSFEGTFARRDTAFPKGLPAGLAAMFGTGPAKMRGVTLAKNRAKG